MTAYSIETAAKELDLNARIQVITLDVFVESKPAQKNASGAIVIPVPSKLT